MRKLGGTPYALPFSEVYSALATGLVDAVITSTTTAVDAKFWEVLKYFQRFNIAIAIDMVNVNMNAFNKLDKATQKVLIDTGQEMEIFIWDQVGLQDKEKEKVVNEKGIKSVPVSPELMKQLRAVGKSIHDSWLKKAPPASKKIYQEFVNSQAK